MALNELQPHVDYFYCLECVQCARCMGECGLCNCWLAGRCFGKNKIPMQMHMYVVEFEGEG